ncbi:hypothetical protein [Hymenobacter negativus]|uniref:Uncharacterized protein n=1 Tax=Hymenobacter negativus TaxID=2795026 RepID=A0ABS3Q8M8_9BACT|nr:hypothetical protein [Hymenobacter negativus]MBO2007609.1 hypothetical protein [Hymenobacter negativus]
MPVINQASEVLKRIIFYWLTAFGCATVGYGLLWALLPGHHVFGAPYGMYLYQDAHPLAYIALCCGCFGPLAAGATDTFGRRGRWGQVGIVGLVALATVVVSAPLGGMLWEWHDMQAGYFPSNWGRILLLNGFGDGLALGWLIVLLSVPYNVLGLLVCYGLLRAGARRFPTRRS